MSEKLHSTSCEERVYDLIMNMRWFGVQTFKLGLFELRAMLNGIDNYHPPIIVEIIKPLKKDEPGTR